MTIVDHLLGAQLVYVPSVAGGGGLPIGAAGWHYVARVGSAVQDVDRVRLLKT